MKKILSYKETERVRFLQSQYGSYRKGIIKYFVENVLKSGVTILDPMAGNGLLIPLVEKEGAIGYFNDIMPFHYYLNKAKTYKTFSALYKAEKSDKGFLYHEALSCLSLLRNKRLVVSENWIHERNLLGLVEAWNRASSYGGSIRDLLRAIIILCVRPYSCFTPSKSNGTWLKDGGVSTGESLSRIVKTNIQKFTNYFSFHYAEAKISEAGKCYFSQKDATMLSLDIKVDNVFTSPPYCNRLEPENMYAPELFFLKAVGEQVAGGAVMGTTKVKGYIDLGDNLEYVRMVSPKTGKFLESVRETERKTEKNYYLKYFTRYYTKLYRTLENMMKIVKRQGRVYINIQDNIHRGELNDTADFIADFFGNQGWHTSIPYQNLHSHQGRRNISEHHPLVIKKHWEHIIEAWR